MGTIRAMNAYVVVAITILSVGCAKKPGVVILPASGASPPPTPPASLSKLISTLRREQKSYSSDYERMLREMNRTSWAACFLQEPNIVADALGRQGAEIEGGVIGGPHSGPTFTMEVPLGNWQTATHANHKLRLVIFCGGSELDHTRQPQPFEETVLVRGAWVSMEREWDQPLSSVSADAHYPKGTVLDLWLHSPQAQEQSANDPILNSLSLGYAPQLSDSGDEIEFRFSISARCLPLSRDESKGSQLHYSVLSAMDRPLAAGNAAAWAATPDEPTLSRDLGPITPRGGYTFANGAATNWYGMPTSDPVEIARARMMLSIQYRDAQGLNRIAWEIVDPQSKLQTKDLDLAMAAATKAAEFTDRKDGMILDTLAWVYFQKGDADEAVKVEREAIKIIRSDYLSDARASLQKFEAARN